MRAGQMAACATGQILAHRRLPSEVGRRYPAQPPPDPAADLFADALA